MHNTKESLQFEDIPAAMSIVLENLKQIKEEINEMKKSRTENKGNTHIPIGIERVSDLTGKAVTTLYRYTANGLIPCYKKGKAILFFEDEIIPDFDSLKIPFFLRSDNQYIVKSADFSG